MALPLIPFASSIISWLFTQIYRFLISEVILFLLGLGLVFFAEEIQDFVRESIIDPINEFIDSILDSTEDYLFGLISDFKKTFEPVLTALTEKINDTFDVDIDILLSLQEVALVIDNYVNTLASTINVSLSAYIETLLNPIKEDIKNVKTDIDNIISDLSDIETSINTELKTAWTDTVKPVQDYIDTTIGLTSASQTFLNNTSNIADFAAAELEEGKVIDSAFITAYKISINNKVNTETEQLKNAVNNIIQLPDLSFPDSLNIELDSIQSIITTLNNIKTSLSNSLEIVNGLIKKIERYIMTTLIIKLRVDLEAYAKSFFAVAWAIKLEEFRQTLRDDTETLKTDFDNFVSGYKEELTEKFGDLKKDIAQNGTDLISKITPDLIKPRLVRLTEKLEDHASKAGDLLKNVNIGEYVQDLDNVDSILVSLPDLTHQAEPAKKKPDTLELGDCYRMLVNYFSRPERIAIALSIADNDMKLDAKSFYDDVLARLDNDE